MMLPGAVSLGAYEAGALAAVLTAVQAADGELVVDAIAAASAGSITAVVACRALQCGADPVQLMEKAWVGLPSLEDLTVHETLDAPLSLQGLKDGAETILTASDAIPNRPDLAQKVSVHLNMTLTALGGLTYAMTRPTLTTESGTMPSAETLYASTFVDFYRAEIPPNASDETFMSLMAPALASGSTPVGFPPYWLDRSDVRQNYLDNGIVMPPGQTYAAWYSDGGDVDNQPLGRLIDVIEEIGATGDDRRVIVILNIEPAGAPHFTGTWFTEDPTPSWLSTLLHVNQIRSNQSLYDDLRTLEKTNERIRWIKAVARASGTGLTDAQQSTAAELAKRRADIDNRIRRATGGAPVAQSSPATTIEDLLLEAAGLSGKREIPVEIISPYIDPDVHLTADQQLSGEFLFHFGGFFDVKYRESDFALGYRNAQSWLESWLPGVLDTMDPAQVLESVKSAYQSLPWHDLEEGAANLSTLSLSEKISGVRLLGHISHVVGHDLDADALHKLESGPGHIVQELARKLFSRRRPTEPPAASSE
jgi:predicted acylesterase/phospholipase RssA